MNNECHLHFRFSLEKSLHVFPFNFFTHFNFDDLEFLHYVWIEENKEEESKWEGT